jgi:serine acetyltransferase
VADAPSNDAPFRLISDVEFGERAVVYSFTNLYGCVTLGASATVGAGAVVTRDIRARATVVGSPARVRSRGV